MKLNRGKLQSIILLPAMPLTYDDVLSSLWIVVAIMIVIVLYHVLFIVVDLRKILKRFDELTEQVESVLMKPLSLAEQFLGWVLLHFEQMVSKRGKKKSRIQ